MTETDIKNAELVKKINSLIKKLEDAEREIERIKNKKLNTHAGIDSRMSYKDDKREMLNKYNNTSKTNYKYISEAMECIYKSGVSCAKIAKIFEMTPAAISVILAKIGVPARARGGSNPRLILSKTTIQDIRESNKPLVSFAKKYKISMPTIIRIRHKRGRWANL